LTCDRGEFGKSDEKERPPLEAAAKKQLVKAEKTLCAVVTVNFGECNSVRLLHLLVVIFNKCSVNPIKNQTPSIVTQSRENIYGSTE
jgi:hypothetical protein